MKISHLAMLGLLLSLFAISEIAQAQAAQSLLLGPSVRASGTGRSSVASFWGGDADYWTNPSLLAYQHGLRFEHGSTHLIPDLADDVYLKTDRFTYQRYGIGLGLSASPFGRNRLDYGEATILDSLGNDAGTFESSETYRYFGVGVSFSALLQAVTEPKSRTHSWSSYGDIAIGFAHKRVHLELAPRWAVPEGSPSSGDGETNDLGLLIRLTPVNSIGGQRSLVPIFDEALAQVGGVRLDFSHGRSDQNYTNNLLEYDGDEPPDAMERAKNEGVGIHAALGFPPALAKNLESTGLEFLAETLSPLISYGWSNQRITRSSPRRGARINNSGWELTLLNVVTFREGDISDPEGDIRGSTSGWGIGFDYKNYGGVRYDRAEVPQARALARVERSAFTVFVDPYAIYERLSERP